MIRKIIFFTLIGTLFVLGCQSDAQVVVVDGNNIEVIGAQVATVSTSAPSSSSVVDGSGNFVVDGQGNQVVSIP
jgi:imidazolonepropionase-like amidohydrolase